MSSSIEVDNNSLVVKTPYSKTFVDGLKAVIPQHARKWDGPRKAWLVDVRYGKDIQTLVERYYNEKVVLPPVSKFSQIEQRLMEIRYIGITKDRGDQERSAFGFCENEWSVMFSEPVLRAWFCAGDAMPTEKLSLYAVLGITNSAQPEEIKTAYRRMAKQWHPDVCKEANAIEQFRAIQQAFDVLNNAKKRARYEAGLTLENSFRQTQNLPKDIGTTSGYRSPLRCGLIYATGTETLGRFAVNKILAWHDIVENGKTLVTSWAIGADMFQEMWV